jgi:hypothetical protein
MLTQTQFKTHALWDALKNVHTALQAIAGKPEADACGVDVASMIGLAGYLDGDLQRVIPEFSPAN